MGKQHGRNFTNYYYNYNVFMAAGTIGDRAVPDQPLLNIKVNQAREE
jgi:hypothetical protein